MPTLTQLVDKEIQLKVQGIKNTEQYKRFLPETSVHLVARRLAKVIDVELSGLGRGSDYYTLRMINENDWNVQPRQILFNDDAEDYASIEICVVGFAERVEYLGSSEVNRFASVDLRVFVRGFEGTIPNTPSGDDSIRDVRLTSAVTDAALSNLQGVIADLLQISELYSGELDLSYTKRAANPELISGGPSGVSGKEVLAQFWANSDQTEYLGRYRFIPRESEILTKEAEDKKKKQEGDKPDYLVLKYTKKGDETLVKEKLTTMPDLTNYTEYSFIKVSDTKVKRTSQDILVQEITTDEGVLGQDIATGEINIEVRYQ